MQMPQPGDLISIDKEVEGAIISEDPANEEQKYVDWSLVKVHANQNALVLEAHEAYQVRSKLHEKEEITVMVIAIGSNIVEVVYNPECMSILNL